MKSKKTKRVKLKRNSSLRITTVPHNKDLMSYRVRRKSTDVWTEEDYDLLYRSSQLGLTVDQIAHVMCMSIDAFYRAMKIDSKIKDALDQGRAMALKYVTEKNWENIVAGKQSAIMFYLRCKGGWKYTDVLEMPDFTKMSERDAENTLKQLSDTELHQLGALLAKADKARREKEEGGSTKAVDKSLH